MRFLSISAVFPPSFHGGTPTTAYSVARSLIQQRHEVFAICTSTEQECPPSLDEETEWGGVPVMYCSRQSSLIPYYSSSLSKEVAARVADHDVAIIRSSWTHVGPAASRECRRHGRPYLAYPEGNLQPWALGYRQWKKKTFWALFDRKYFEGASALVALTEYEAQSMRRMGLTNRIEVIPNGVDVITFTDGLPRAELEVRFPRIKGRRLILFLGRIHPIKGLWNLIMAFEKVRSYYPDALLIVAGPGEVGHRRELERLVRQQNLSGQVLFTGSVAGKVKVGLLRSSEVFVLTSLSEGFPITVLEALASQLPVVLSENCHIPQVTEAGAGIEVDASVPSIVNALTILLSDDLARVQMGKRGYELAASRFSWERVARMTAQLCREIVESM